MAQRCEVIRQQFDNRPTSVLRRTSAKDAALLDVTAGCSEDMYLNVPWDKATFTTAMCARYQQFVDRERRDIMCADQALRTFKLDDSAISKAGFDAASDASALTYVNNLRAMQAEVMSSQDNIVYWDNGECVLQSLDLKANPENCATHTFINTLLSA